MPAHRLGFRGKKRAGTTCTLTGSLAADDWLYWTNNGQNWNAMCAECHSTDLRKNYDPDDETYRTAWSEISVGCEACHGPGSDHVAWAQLPEMGRPDVANTALAVKTSELTSARQVQLCAPCHARRMSLDDNIHAHADFLDYGIPQLLNEGMYFPDGQILDEVYVYGSFIQSKMHAREVRCSDCHDVHSIQTHQRRQRPVSPVPPGGHLRHPGSPFS